MVDYSPRSHQDGLGYDGSHKPENYYDMNNHTTSIDSNVVHDHKAVGLHHLQQLQHQQLQELQELQEQQYDFQFPYSHSHHGTKDALKSLLRVNHHHNNINHWAQPTSPEPKNKLPLINDHVKAMRHLAKSGKSQTFVNNGSSNSSYEDGMRMSGRHSQSSSSHNRNISAGTNMPHELLSEHSKTSEDFISSRDAIPDWDTLAPPPQKSSHNNLKNFFGFGRKKRSKDRDINSFGMSSDDMYLEDNSSSLSLSTPGRERRQNQNQVLDMFSFDPKSMEGIVAKETLVLPRDEIHLEISPTWIDSTETAWAPPDSWAVQPAVENGQEKVVEDIQDRKHSFCVRIFRKDSTFVTISCAVGTTTQELMQLVAKKFFLPNTQHYRLFAKRYHGHRVLADKERPVVIQKRLLEQAGYTESDRLEDLGREDNSYLVRFYVDEATPPTLSEELATDVGYEHVDLSRRNFQTIPIFLYRHAHTIISLNLSLNSWIDLPSDFVQLCANLRELRYSRNEVRRVPPSIQFISSLTHLDLSSNRLDDLSHGNLETIRELASLKLQNNHLECLPSSFERFTFLRTLDISNNQFKEVPLVVLQLKGLADLDLSFNEITTLPERFGELNKLERLHIVSNQVSGPLPKSMENMRSLRQINLRRNKITNIDPLVSLPLLTVFDFDHNTLTSLDVKFPAVVKLNLVKNPIITFDVTSPAPITFLDLSFAKLSNLNHTCFDNLLQLETLILDHNHLVALPHSIGQLQRLTSLSIIDNQLQTLPTEIGLLTSLEFLDVHSNNISVLPSEMWNLPRLRELNVSSNLLESFPSMPGGRSLVPVPVPAAATTSISESQSEEKKIIEDRKQSTPGTTVITVSSKSRTDEPPPLIASLQKLLMADNRINDDIFFSPMSLLSELRVLNLSCNELFEIPSGRGAEGLSRHSHLEELYLSCNQLASFPGDDIEKLANLRILHLNGNKLQTLPAELGKIRRLLVLDVGNNSLKYNICNWPYDWNWNWNLDLKYLNLSGNKRLEIKTTTQSNSNQLGDRNLSDFSALTKLRILGLMDVTLMSTVPDETEDRRIRTSASEVNNISYGMADTLGKLDHLTMTDVVVPRFRGREDEALFGLFDGRASPTQGNRISRYLYEWFSFQFNSELSKLRPNDDVKAALRRTFIGLEKDLGTTIEKSMAKDGASGCVVYLAGAKVYVANVGSVLAIVSNEGNPKPLSVKHFGFRREEAQRIRSASGFLDADGLVNGEIDTTRAFGHFDLVPIVNSSPFIVEYDLSSTDEFIIVGSKNFWDKVSFNTAVDVARGSRGDLMMAAQKLRDFAIAYGAEGNVMVMVIGVGELFAKRFRSRGRNASTFKGVPTAYITRRVVDATTENGVGDSTLARLQDVPAPTGLIAIAFTDIQNSTRLWESNPSAMRAAMRTHNAIMRRLIRMNGGYEVKTEGDAFIVSFQNVTAAILWAFQCQLALLTADWPKDILDLDDGGETYDSGTGDLLYRGLRVRMGIHYGTPVCERDPITGRMDYFGPMMNRAARVSAVADGGQICVSSDLITVLKQLEQLFCVDLENPDSEALVNIVSPNGEETEISVADIDEDFKREVLSLKKMGLHIKEIGERKLKGLETPEYLAFLYCTELLGRRTMDEKEKQGTDVEPTVAFAASATTPTSAATSITTATPISSQPAVIKTNIDSAMVKSFGCICVRLEKLAVVREEKINSNNEFSLNLINLQVKEAKTERELLYLLESFIGRIENAISTLHLGQLGGYGDVLTGLSELVGMDPNMLMQAIRMFACINVQ